MIQAIIRFSATNRFLVLLATAVRRGLRRLHPQPHPARRDPRPLRHPGHRLLALGPKPRHHRGPGHLPDRDRAARRAEGQGDPRLLRLRLLVRLRDLQGRHRHLLGAQPRARVPVQDPAAAARRACRTELGPDATGVGWVFQYALVDDSGTHSLAELRTFQDWNLRYRLQSVPGVAEVASIGGFVKQYQVTVDPNRLKAYDLAIMDVAEAIRAQQQRGRRAAARVRGHASTWCAAAATCESTEDLEKIVVKTDETGHAGAARATSARSRSARRSAAASPTSTATATPSAASSSCATARTRST